MRAHDYRPQLAMLVRSAPVGDEWLHEIKFDGYRIGAQIRRGRVTLISRTGRDWTASFPEIAEALARLDVDDALIDGEVAMVMPDGRTSFQALQNASSRDGARAGLVYFVFDLLRLDGARLERLPLEERKARLRRLVGARAKGRLRYSTHVEGYGEDFFANACRLRLEGIISKRRDGPYRAGRHGDWAKTKCVRRQEFVIGGFTDPEGSRAGIGALLVGYYQDDRLAFSGKVGTGFTQAVALDLRRRLDVLEQAACPFTPPPGGSLGRHAHWVRPALVGEVMFTEWTADGKIRHPSFQGLRHDKKPRDVRRETPAAPPGSTPGRAEARPDRPASGPIVAGITISHPDRVVFPDEAITKLDLARYFEAVGNWIVPHLEGRPLTLVRCPATIADCHYMRHSNVWAPSALRRVRIQEKTKLGEYLIADTLPAVVALAQMGIVEIHTWNSRIADIERPDRIVVDLDPGERVAWPRVVAAARLVRRALAALDLECWIKTTGGRGLHVVVPLAPHADWSECLAFARALSTRLVRADPGEYTTDFAKAGRAGKILVDYLRNNRTNTSVAAFSTRARPGAPVSMPIAWDELQPSLRPATFTMRNVAGLLTARRADPWAGYHRCRQKLTRQRLRAVETD